MTSPVVEATATSSTDANGATHTISLPADIAAGETILAGITVDGIGGGSWPAGWTEFFSKNSSGASANCEVHAAWRKATGGETTVDFTSVDSEKSSHISYRISGAADPTVTPPEASAGVASNTANPDPDSISPAGGSKTYLFIAAHGHDQQSTTVDAIPAGYSGGLTSYTGTAGGTGMGTAQKAATAASEDPGTFTLSGAKNGVHFTIAVHPAAAASETGPGPEALEWMPETNQPPMTHLALGSLFGGFIPTYTIESSTGPGAEAMEWFTPVSQPYPYRVDARADLYAPAFFFLVDEENFEPLTGRQSWNVIPAWKKLRRLALSRW